MGSRATIGLFLGVTLVSVLGAAGLARAGDVPFKMIKLIGDLNDNAEISAKARAKLMEHGEAAVPALVAEVERYTEFDDRTLTSAARCLRLLQGLGTDAAVEVSIRILDQVDTPSRGEKGGAYAIRRALLAEALHYLALRSSNEKARSAVYRYVGDDPEAADWLEKGELIVDVFPALRALVVASEARIGKRLAELLPKLPYKIKHYETGIYYKLYISHLRPDGFEIGPDLYTRNKADPKRKEEWFDAAGRARIVLLEWLRELKAVEAVDEITKVLRSEHEDERTKALEVAEELSGE